MPTELHTAFATTLRRLRQERSMTQEDLAFESGVGRVSIAKMETAKRLPSLPTLFELARALDIPPGEIVSALSAEARSTGE